jgi:hypothetical protein
MKAQLRNQVAALFLLAPAAITFTALPTAAIAQTATPEVSSLDVTSSDGLNPGSRLHFRMRGSPQAQASVRIRGVEGNIALREVERGIYVGRYVINRGDRIEPGSPIRAIMRNGNRTVTASYNIPSDLGNVAVAPPPPRELRIERFDVAALDRIEPGAELRFRLEGVPGAQVFVDLPGVRNDVQLREVRPGQYAGSYTIKRDDRLNMSRPIVATLRMGDRVVTSELARPLMSAAPAPAHVAIQVLNHQNNARVGDGPTHVRGRTAPFAAVDVKVRAVPPVIGQFGVSQEVFSQTIRADANGHFAFDFTSPLQLPGTRYDVSMVANKADMTAEARLVLFQRES